MTALIDLRDLHFGRLTVLERVENDAQGRTQWACRCSCGGFAVVRAVHLRSGSVQSCGCFQAECGNKRGIKNRTPSPGYFAVHKRTAYERGKASEYGCRHCGGDAEQWAYDHADPAEVAQYVNGYRLTFSLDPLHYIPLCIPCHKEFDNGQR